MAETNEFYIKIGADVDDAMNKLNRLSSQLSQLASSTQRSGNRISGSMDTTAKSISQAFGAMGLALTTAGITTAIIGIGKAALTTAAELEQISVSFRVFTGSAEVAKNMLADLKNQALKSPMQFQDITKGAQTLLQYGLTAQQVVPITRMLGDISGGNADRFNRLALAFGQVNASGRLMGQEARQMINAGFNPLKAISDATGESMASLTQRMHDGQISVKEVGDAFISATSKGGQFFGMADEQSQTLQGQFNKLSESVSFALAEMGDSMAKAFDLKGAVSGILSFMNDFKTAMQSNESVAQLLSLAIEGIKLVVKGLTAALIGLINLWQGLVGVFMFMVNNVYKPIINFFANIYKKIYDFIHGIEFLGKALDWLIGKFTKIDNAKPLELPKVDDSQLTGLSENPSKKQSTGRKTEKVEVIVGTDFQTKEYGTHLKKLQQMSADAIAEINNIGLQGSKKKLADLTDAFNKEKAEFQRYGIDTANITRLYLLKVAQLQGEIESERKGALMKLIKPLPGMEGGMLGKALSDEQLAKFGASTQIALKIAQDTAEKMKMAFLGVANVISASVDEMTQSVASQFADMFSFIGEGGSAGDAIKKFGAGILGALGDMFVKIGLGIVMASKAMIAVQSFLTSMFSPAGATAGLLGGLALMAVGGLLKGVSSALSKPKESAGTSGQTQSVAQKSSGSNYTYGGSSYSAQTIRLAIDLTGAITATQTGYQINKSLETTLRVTGRQ
jgi:tape measure domain-containing protein